jgi:hypothetical protein
VLNGVTKNDTSLISSTVIDLTGTTAIVSPTTGTGACEYVSLEFSSNLYALNNQGVEVMSGMGNSSKTLVGAAYAGTAGSILDDAAHRDVASWFNPETKTCSDQILSGDITGAPAVNYTELSAGLRCEFIILGPNKALWSIAGSALDSTPGSVVNTSLGFDGTTPQMEFTAASDTVMFPISVSGAADLTEGMHYGTLLYKTSAGSATYKVGSSFEVRLAQ